MKDLIATALAAGLGVAGAFAQQGANTIEAHLAAAKAAAGFDFRRHPRPRLHRAADRSRRGRAPAASA